MIDLYSQLQDPEQRKRNKPKLKGHDMVEISEAETKTAAVSQQRYSSFGNRPSGCAATTAVQAQHPYPKGLEQRCLGYQTVSLHMYHTHYAN